MNGPASYTGIVTRLAQMTGGHCLTVRQRMAPQIPFPAALLDVFHAYMCLLAPPPGSPHEAVPASSIILAGDSSDVCLALALLQVLLTLRRQNLASNVEHHGRNVDIELPASLTLTSAVGELTNSLPSYKSNATVDVFPDIIPYVQPEFPACKVWPSKPPRGNLYCDAPTLCHPLASPTASKDWTGSPPMFFASGQEMILDAVKVIAQTTFNQGTSVIFEEYEAMPHIFLWSCAGSPQSEKCWNDWANFCKAIQQGKVVASRAVLVEPKGLREVELDVGKLTPLTVSDACGMIREAANNTRGFTGQKRGRAML
jgi:acetyl esterase/lipase